MTSVKEYYDFVNYNKVSIDGGVYEFFEPKNKKEYQPTIDLLINMTNPPFASLYFDIHDFNSNEFCITHKGIPLSYDQVMSIYENSISLDRYYDLYGI